MREKAQSGRDGRDGLLNRREYIEAVGGSLAVVLGIGTATAQSDEGSDGDGEGDDAGAEDSDGDGGRTDGNAGGNDGSGDGNSGSKGPVGGGDGYPNAVDPSAATATVSSRSDLETALSDAGSGDVVYVAGDATIEMGSSEFTIPAGVTLASNRGIDGSKGGVLRTGDRPWGMLTADDDVRITGIRVGGPRWEWIENVDGELGIDVTGSNVEVDNCEVYGWGYASLTTAEETHVHHNAIHHNPKDGTGYGVSTGSSDQPIIEYNVFHHNRHSVASSEGGYVARYNHVEQGAISHVFDQHKPGGTTIEIHHNTVEAVENAKKDKKAPAVAIRGVPDDVADIHHNWFYNPEEPRDTPDGWTDEAIIQVHTDGWQSVDFANNHYGSDEPGTEVGHPR